MDFNFIDNSIFNIINYEYKEFKTQLISILQRYFELLKYIKKLFFAILLLLILIF
jgi:hypothetical protein